MVNAARTCPTCGAAYGPDARFCSACGAALPSDRFRPGEARKVVTVVFSDIIGSTALGHQLDPESLRRLMTRYFQRMESVLRRHGGTVEKFIGDAVVAVFGIPQSHEDDAVRATRAAVEMRQALHELNDEFRGAWGVSLSTRTGLNTGEVIAGQPGSTPAFIAGDAVNLAARLEQAAPPGEILVGESTYRLVRDAVVAELVGSLQVRGRPAPVSAYRLLEIVPGAPGWSRRLDSALVGRRNELERLTRAFTEAVEARACRAVTVMGPAGIGKSRLTGDFLERLQGRARVTMGRCLPYGDGITFWPVVELLHDTAGLAERDTPAAVRAKLGELVSGVEDDRVVADRLAALLGLAESLPGIEETFWALRKLLEKLAAREPLVVVLDDIQWGEPTFLDLIEYLVDWIQRHPVLLVCLARPELLELRPGWTTGKGNAGVLPLEPLSDGEIDKLIDNLVDEARLPDSARARIGQVAEGNPLFVEETLRMLVDDGLLRLDDGRWRVAGDLSPLSIPSTIHALLAARLDRLEAVERAVAERASVVGREFWRGAVAELCPEELRPTLGSQLQSLTQKELIRPAASELVDEDAFRFTHIVIRDVAYQGIPKAVRAELHERLAGWIEVRASDRAGEYEEILGYHLEQAYQSLLGVGLRTARIEALGGRAAARLGPAGRRAIDRDDWPAGVNLLSRAVALLPAHAPDRLELLPELASGLRNTGDFERLQAVVAEMSEVATAAGDARLLAHVALHELWIRLFTDPEGWPEAARRETTRAISVFEQVGDKRGLGEAWSLLGLLHVVEAQFGPAEEAWEQAAVHAAAAGERRDELEALSWGLLSVWAGPANAEQGLERCREMLERAQGDRKGVASALFMRAVFEAGLGRVDVARGLIGEAKALLREVGLTVWMAGPLTQMAGLVELLADDPAAAERDLRWGHETLSAIGEVTWLSTLVAILAEAVYLQGRLEEAEQLAMASRDSAGSEDVYSQILWRGVQAKVLARRGRSEEAASLARESLALAEPTDSLGLKATALMCLAEVLGLTGHATDAEATVDQAVQLFERKGNIAAARQARRLLEQLPR
jgi:class 3 adenylate cyclase/tetratricopeptide (TPR) repeat protein